MVGPALWACSVGPVGLEPTTYGLKVRSWGLFAVFGDHGEVFAGPSFIGLQGVGSRWLIAAPNDCLRNSCGLFADRRRSTSGSRSEGDLHKVGIRTILLIEIRESLVIAGLRRHERVVAITSGPARKGKNAPTKGQSLFSGRRHRSRERVYNSPMPAEKRRRGHFWIAPEKSTYADLGIGGRTRLHGARQARR
jgi:hypothetical protein